MIISLKSDIIKYIYLINAITFSYTKESVMFKKSRYILAVYREGSITKAAEKLYISQPCLSTAIKQLERELGFPLFERTPSSVKPTELGLEYVRVAEQIIALEEGFASRVRDVNSLSAGILRVGGSNYVSSYILPRIVDKFSKCHPSVTVSLTERSSSELLSMLKNGDLDIIADSFDREPDGCVLHPISKEKIILAVPAAFVSNDSVRGFGATPSEIFDGTKSCDALPALSIEQFKRESFILLKSGNSMYEHAMRIFRSASFAPDVSMYLDQLSTSYFLASQGNGCCFVTDTVFRYHRFEDAVLLYNVIGGGERTLGLAYRKNALCFPAISEFIKLSEIQLPFEQA